MHGCQSSGMRVGLVGLVSLENVLSIYDFVLVPS